MKSKRKKKSNIIGAGSRCNPYGVFHQIYSGDVPRFFYFSVAKQCVAPMRIIGSGVLGRTPNKRFGAILYKIALLANLFAKEIDFIPINEYNI